MVDLINILKHRKTKLGIFFPLHTNWNYSGLATSSGDSRLPVL